MGLPCDGGLKKNTFSLSCCFVNYIPDFFYTELWQVDNDGEVNITHFNVVSFSCLIKKLLIIAVGIFFKVLCRLCHIALMSYFVVFNKTNQHSTFVTRLQLKGLIFLS